MKFTKLETMWLFKAFNSLFMPKTKIVDEHNISDMIESLDFNTDEEKESVRQLLSKLEGFKFKFKQYGEHHTDGCIVDYYLKLKHPDGRKGEIGTTMCLMMGWDEDEELNIE